MGQSRLLSALCRPRWVELSPVIRYLTKSILCVVCTCFPGSPQAQLRHAVLLLSTGGPVGVRRAPAADHRPHLLLRGQGHAQLHDRAELLQD